MAHDEPAGLAYADYFAAAAVATLVPEVDAVGGAGEGPLHLYGVHHQHGVDMFGAGRGHMPPAAMMAGPAASATAHGKAALGGVGGHDFGDHHHRQGLLQAPLSLSLHGTADAVPLGLHHHHQLAGGVPRQQHQPAAAWPGPQQQPQGAWHLRGSRFLRPTQQLLQEFCTLPVDTTSTAAASKLPTRPASEDGVGAGSSSSAPSAQIQAMSASELQRLKAKLYAMLQEVLLSDRPSLTTPQVTIHHHTRHRSASRISSRQEPLLVLGNLKSCMQVGVQLWLGLSEETSWASCSRETILGLPSAFGNLHSLACRCSNASVQGNL
jgi:hypothetical protein